MTHGEYRQSFLSYNPSQLLHLIPQPGREVAVAELPEGGTIVVSSSQLAVSRQGAGHVHSFIHSARICWWCPTHHYYRSSRIWSSPNELTA